MDNAFLIRCGPWKSYDIIEVKADEINFFGRDEDFNDEFRFPSMFVSRDHLDIYCHDGTWYIYDSNSTNGTFLYRNSVCQRIIPQEPFELCHGDKIGFGVHVGIWATKKEYFKNPDYFVYDFVLTK